MAGPQQSVTTQDLLQPLQKSLNPGGSSSSINLSPNCFVLQASKPYGNGDPSAGQQSNYAYSNGSFELRETFPSKYRSSNISFGAKGQVPHAIPLNKHWQQPQQQQQSGLEVLEGNKRLTRVPSEEDEDEDDESFDHGYSARKESPYQKSDSMLQLEGKIAESKGATPRSKHSATEQRRRSKINDRFQMLRQLLPNADQKRDKASFLLEVIEYIQMLHEKVKKYEGGADFRGKQHQERTKVLSWDRNAGQQDVTYISTHDAKDISDTNGFMRNRLSPLRVMAEDGVTAPELMCSVVQASGLHTASCYLPNYESKPLISKSIPMTFSQPPAITTQEHVPNPAYQSMMPEGGRTMFGQLQHQEEQAALKVCMLSNKADMVPSHLQQARNISAVQDSSQVADLNFQKSRNVEQNLAILSFRRPDNDAEGRTRFNQMADMSLVSKDMGMDANKLTYCPDGMGTCVTDLSKVEQRSEIGLSEQGAPVVLSGVINISSAYSQGLLDTLTRALQSSGVDMAQATISVQIDLGKAEGSGHSSSQQRLPLHTGALPFQNIETAPAQESLLTKKRPKIEAD